MAEFDGEGVVKGSLSPALSQGEGVKKTKNSIFLNSKKDGILFGFPPLEGLREAYSLEGLGEAFSIL